MFLSEQHFNTLMLTLFEDKVGMCFRRNYIKTVKEPFCVINITSNVIKNENVKKLGTIEELLNKTIKYEDVMKEISHIKKPNFSILCIYCLVSKSYISLLYNGHKGLGFLKEKLKWDIPKKFNIKIDLNYTMNGLGFKFNLFGLKELLFNVSKHKYSPELIAITNKNMPEFLKNNKDKIAKIYGAKDPLYRFYGIDHELFNGPIIYKIIHKNNIVNNTTIYCNYRLII
jgi:hypothetical protein